MENNKKIILAFVGMPGAGKSEAVLYIEKKGIPFVRFGQLTDEEVHKRGLELNPVNEKLVREQLRAEFGMAAYAIKAKPKIAELIAKNRVIAIDGLYSWEEYTFLKNEFSSLILIHIYAEPAERYKRLVAREIRPVPLSESRARDIAELEKLNKGGPIAIADYMIENKTNLEDLHTKIDSLLQRLGIS